MALPTATICNQLDCICPGNISNDLFKQYVLGLLCNLNTGGPGAAGVDSELLQYCDPITGDPVYVQYTYDFATGAPVGLAAFNPDGTAYAGSIAALTICSASCITPEITCKCDDVAGDGSNIIPYVEARTICVTSGVLTSTLIGTYTDATCSVVYVPVNGKNCSAIGTPSKLSQQRTVLNGAGSFTVTSDMIGYTIKVLSAAGGPTFTGSDALASPMFVGETITFSLDSGYARLLKVGASVTTLAGDLVTIDYQKLTV